jgi:hypothetical protein
MCGDSGDGPDPQEIKDNIERLGGKVTIARERAPTTGRVHYHCYAVHGAKAFQTRNQDYFNIGLWHPNIKAVTSGWQRVWDYVTKGNDILFQDVERPSKERAKKRSDEVFKAALAAQTKYDMLRAIEDGEPSTFARCYLNIRACAIDKFPDPGEPEYHHPRNATFDLDPWPALQAWTAEYMPYTGPGRDAQSIPSRTPSLTSNSTWEPSVFSGESGSEGAPPTEDWGELDIPRYGQAEKSPPPHILSALQPRPKSLILWGRTRTGKTCWARSLGRHVHHANTVNMERHTDDIEYAVFDDLGGGLRGLDYKSWLGGQHHFNITDKYMKKKSVTWGKPSIYIANEDPFVTERGVDLDWLSENTICVHIDRPMYI